MPFNTLLLPLLGGYLFITRCHRFKFGAERAHGYHLLFKSSIAGFLTFIPAYVATSAGSAICPPLSQAWSDLVPFEYLGTSLLAFVLGPVAACFLNFWITEEDAISRVIKTQGDPLELLLEKAMNETRVVLVTLQSGKVYVGFVTCNLSPSFETQSICIAPTTSGFRDPSTQRVEFTEDYSGVYDKLLGSAGDLNCSPEDFQIVIPTREIRSIGTFDPEAYEFFQMMRPR